MHAYIHKDVVMYVCLHTYLKIYIQMCTQAYMHTYPCMPSYIYTYLHVKNMDMKVLIHSLVHVCLYKHIYTSMHPGYIQVYMSFYKSINKRQPAFYNNIIQVSGVLLYGWYIPSTHIF